MTFRPFWSSIRVVGAFTGEHPWAGNPCAGPLSVPARHLDRHKRLWRGSAARTGCLGWSPGSGSPVWLLRTPDHTASSLPGGLRGDSELRANTRFAPTNVRKLSEGRSS